MNTRNLLIAAVLALLLALAALSGCAGKNAGAPASEAPAVTTPSAPLDAPISLIFTVRTDTREGVWTILWASGIAFLPMTDEQLAMDAAYCQTEALVYGIDPEQYDTVGIITSDGQVACYSKAALPRDTLEAMARQMKPPRRVLRYDPATRAVTFGPAGGLPS